MTTYESLFILGRQPDIGKAELESVFGAEHLKPLGEFSVISDLPIDRVAFERLGGSIRLAKPLFVVPSIKWTDIKHQLAKQLPSLVNELPTGKLKLGLSAYGIKVDIHDLMRAGLELKKICKSQGRSMRLVPNTDAALNTAQVIHNQLTNDLGIELLLVRHGDLTYIAKTLSIQDIEAYAKRDRERPKRDTRVGMLPPKLAQIIVNLAVGNIEPNTSNVVLDPFCGTGVALQEALLMGYGAYGTDLEPRMIDYSRANLKWLGTTEIENRLILEVGDATTYRWNSIFCAVASETYLGHPLSSWPNLEKLREIIKTCDTIIKKFLINISKQLPAGTRLCLAVPAWQSPSEQIYHLPLLDQIEILGYNRVSFSSNSGQNMIYSRPGQLVSRELLVITRNK